MKLLLKSIALILVMMQFAACKTSSTPPSSNNTTLLSGSFIITTFLKSGDHTASMAGYTFEFSNSGVLKAISSAETIIGTWSRDDSEQELKINFPLAPLDNLNGSWHIESQTNDMIKLIDDNTSDDDDRLEFERK